MLTIAVSVYSIVRCLMVNKPLQAITQHHCSYIIVKETFLPKDMNKFILQPII